jgi:hypothetical protein
MAHEYKRYRVVSQGRLRNAQHFPARLELVRTAAFLVRAVARQGRDLPGILTVSGAVLLAVCADTRAGFVGAFLRLARHTPNLRTALTGEL